MSLHKAYDLYNEMVNKYLKEYDSTIEYQDMAKSTYEEFKGTDLERELGYCYSMKIRNSSKVYQKQLTLDFTDGINFEGKHFNSIDFYIDWMVSDEEARKKGFSDTWFNLRDYYTYKRIEKDIISWIEVVSTEQALSVSKKFNHQVAFLLEQDDIQHILHSTDWLDVPHDKSMYF